MWFETQWLNCKDWKDRRNAMFCQGSAISSMVCYTNSWQPEPTLIFLECIILCRKEHTLWRTKESIWQPVKLVANLEWLRKMVHVLIWSTVKSQTIKLSFGLITNVRHTHRDWDSATSSRFETFPILSWTALPFNIFPFLHPSSFYCWSERGFSEYSKIIMKGIPTQKSRLYHGEVKNREPVNHIDDTTLQEKHIQEDRCRV